MNVLTRGLTVAACTGALLAPAAIADARTASVRVEGQTRTLLPATQVTIPDSGVIPGAASDCEWDDPAGALEAGTNGSWDRSNFVQTILGETAGSNDGWFVWVDGKYANGNCFDKIAASSTVIFTHGAYDANFNPVDLPLTVREVPQQVVQGQPFTVSVDQIQPAFAPGQPYYEGGTGTPAPAAGATVTAGGASTTVGADGKATLTATQTGATNVQATRGTGPARSAPVPLTVVAPGTPVTSGTPSSPSAPAVVDRTAPAASVASIADKKVFASSKAPRLLGGKVDEANGILMVKLRLTRTSKGQCSAFSAKRERFIRRPKCGADEGWWWNVGDDAAWEYQLPSRLPAGRYVLDVKAIDKSYNRDEERRRGENRVIFEVR